MITSDSTKLWVRALTITTVAAAGLVLSGCSLLGQVSDIAGGEDDNTDTGTEDDVFALVVGDCFNEETDAETVSTVDIVECDVPHTWEAFASILMTQEEYPGDEATQQEADTSCNQPFIDYVGLDYDASKYDYSFYYPTEETWNDATLKDREILCLGKADDESDITGSIKGANE
jgi:hypothetical protein